MSTDQNQPEDSHLLTISVEKSDVMGLVSMLPEAGIDGEYLWPIHPLALANLYRASAEHCRAIHIKAEGAFGGGLIGRTEPIDELCETGAAELFVLLGLDIETFGNAFLQVIRSNDGSRVIGLRRLPAVTMSRFRDGFLQRIPQITGGDKKVIFSAGEIIHLRVPCPMGRRYSEPAWIGVREMLELARAAIRFNSKFFDNGAVPEFAIIFKGTTPSDAQKKTIREFFRREFQGVENAHRTMLLSLSEDDSVTFEKLTADVKDGDFLKMIDAVRDRIPVAHGVPPRMLGIMSAGQLGGGGEVAGQMHVFEHLTLRPMRRRMLDQLRPIFKEFGLRPGNPDEPLADDQIAFRPLDLTPPGDVTDNLADLVTAGVLTDSEAKAIYYGDTTGLKEVTSKSSSTGADLSHLVRILAKS
ncbi:phage portal protein [Paenirhodobacter sp.]|uniref:phage portal protein n=1 Tax=Paenirhodobacter sp. TaxID=1965326 RepID=UPI003D0E6B94